MYRYRTFIGLTSLVSLILFMVGSLFYFIVTYDTTRFDINQPIIIEIKKNQSANDLAAQLKQHNLINNTRLFKIWMSFKGLDKKIMAGEFVVTPNETFGQFIRKVIKSHTYLRKFTIIPGQRWEDVEKNIKKSFLKPLTKRQIRLLKGRSPTLEGLFKPDTYYYEKNDSAFKILRNAKARQKKLVHDIWDQRNDSLGISSPDEILTIASMIEKETHIPSEYKKISAVIYNRLDAGIGLNIDATVIYALLAKGIIEHPSEFRRIHLGIKSRYNTYRYSGLPPGPIAYPSKETIEAAANPTMDHYLYYRVGRSGKHIFTKSFKEHQNVMSFSARFIRVPDAG